MENNKTDSVTYISADQFTLSVLIPLLNPLFNGYQEHMKVYVFTEKNLGDFMTSFNELYVGGPSIILVDARLKHILANMPLWGTSTVFMLNKPVGLLLSHIEKYLERCQLAKQQNTDPEVFNLMVMLYHLNERERDVMAMMLDGNNQSDIANKLGLTAKIVSSCKLSAIAKMGMKTLLEIQAFLKLYSTLIQKNRCMTPDHV
jgi:DNA-binding CsgD family transcriptional regulator